MIHEQLQVRLECSITFICSINLERLAIEAFVDLDLEIDRVVPGIPDLQNARTRRMTPSHQMNQSGRRRMLNGRRMGILIGI